MKLLLPKPAEKLFLPKPTGIALKRAKYLFMFSLFATWLIMPELLWHKLSFVAHHVAVLLHLIYETLSFMLEEGLIHGLGMQKYYAQMLVFYLFLMLVCWFLYRLWKRLPHLYQSFKTRLILLGAQLKYQAIETWRSLTVLQKIKFVLFQLAGMVGGVMFLLA